MRVKNWNRFQHFKDRRPIWIKLYRDLMDDPEWFSLSGEDAKRLVMVWIVASDDEKQEGNLPDIKTLAFRLRTTESETIQTLTRLSHWLIFDDTDLISTCHQDDILEKRREEKRQRREENKEKGDAPQRARKVFVPPTADQVREYLAEKGFVDIDPEAFVAHYQTRGWVVGKARTPMACWKSAITTWRKINVKGLFPSRYGVGNGASPQGDQSAAKYGHLDGGAVEIDMDAPRT